MDVRKLLAPHRAPLALVLLLGIWLRAANFGNVAARTPDERVYTQQAKVWLTSGTEGMRGLVETFLRDPVARYYPTPTRAGIVRMTALAMRVTGRQDESAGALVSCLASIGSLIVVALLAARFLPPWGALFALLFYAVAPQELAIARRLWPDAMIELPAALTVWFACEAAAGTRESARRVWFPLMALAGAAGVAVRETFPVFFVFYLLWILWVLAVERRDRKDALLLLGWCGAGMAATVLWLGSAVGSLSTFIRIASNGAAVNAVNDYALQYASGPPWLVLEAFWIASPIAAAFAAAGFWAAFAERREKPYGRVQAGMAAATLACLAVMMSVPHYVNLRYFSVLFGPIYLLAGLGFWHVTRWCAAWMASTDRRLVTAMAAAVLIAGAAGDYLRFQRFFVRDSAPDLSIKMLQDERNR